MNGKMFRYNDSPHVIVSIFSTFTPVVSNKIVISTEHVLGQMSTPFSIKVIDSVAFQ